MESDAKASLSMQERFSFVCLAGSGSRLRFRFSGAVDIVIEGYALSN